MRSSACATAADRRGRRIIDRLDRSLGELRIDWPVARPALGFIMRELMRRNRLRDGLIYMQVTRGVARRDHAFPDHAGKPALVLTTKNSQACRRRSRPGRRGDEPCPTSAGSAATSRRSALLPNVLAKQAARESGAYEAWLIDDKGCVTEGASTNAWIVTADGELVTRPTDNGILAGITRGTLKKIAGDLQLKFVERPFTLAEAQEGAGGLHHQRHVVRDAGGEDRRRRRSATARSARRRAGCARNMSASRAEGEAVT